MRDVVARDALTAALDELGEIWKTLAMPHAAHGVGLQGPFQTGQTLGRSMPGR